MNTPEQDHYLQIGLANKKHCDMKNRIGYTFEECPECNHKGVEMKKSKSGVIIYRGKWLDMYELRNYRLANGLRSPSDVSVGTLERFLAKRSSDGACGLCGSAKSSKSGLCLRGCVEETPRRK